MDQIFHFIKAHYQYVLIVVGILYALTAYFDLFGINEYSIADSGNALKCFIYECFGEKGYRIMNIIIGLGLVICGVIFLIYGK